MADVIRDFWHIGVAFIALVVWLIRLESRGVANTKEIERLWRTRKADMDARQVQRAEDMAAAKDQRKEFRDMLDEIRADVKKLLSNHA